VAFVDNAALRNLIEQFFRFPSTACSSSTEIGIGYRMAASVLNSLSFKTPETVREKQNSYKHKYERMARFFPICTRQNACVSHLIGQK